MLLTLLYYFAGESAPLAVFHGYAPALVAAPLMTLYALAYAVAAGLAAWESGRLTSSGVWALAAGRSRFHVAANALLPVFLLSWAVLIVPVSLSLARTTTFPTVDSLRLLVMALILCVAHAVIGFGIGIRAPRVIAAPIVAVVVWILVAFSRATHPYWLRHVSGQYMDLDFGEVPGMASLVAPILFGGGIALGVALLWFPLRWLLVRVVLACIVAGLCTFGAYNIVKDWGHDPPMVTGQAPMECLGNAPKVCMPKATSSTLGTVRKEAVSVLDDLGSRGVTETPSVITDRLADGRSGLPSTQKTWRIGLTAAAQRDEVRFEVLTAAVRFPCRRVDPVTGHAAWLWAASVTGEEKAYRARVAQETQTPDAVRAEKQVQDIVQRVLAQPAKEQGTWFRQTLISACRGNA
ncbi:MULTISPECIES: DUF7224 domain-containing protein [Streptomyces]|uniref:DUF7224 domain-containing protein n=1 Tax=Streptomyces TaxID=1883 RepID=UPI00131EBE87